MLGQQQASQPIHVLKLQLKALVSAGNKRRYIPASPDEGGSAMNLNPQHMKSARALAVALIATVSLGACASYKNEFAKVGS